MLGPTRWMAKAARDASLLPAVEADPRADAGSARADGEPIAVTPSSWNVP
jgi:hypothetical protein